jgi:NADP-dependent 3-hydroxy acid dehydrogenase YdfG
MVMSGKVIAITGASSGIGEAAARLLARSGAQLVLGARRAEKLAAVAEGIAKAGGTAIPAALDVTSLESMRAFVDLARERFGRIDVLVNNAGVMLVAPLGEARIDEWNQMVDVNLRGVLNGVAAALPPMIAQGAGHIVIVGSTSGRRVTPTSGIYAATKFAVRAVADSIRLECGPAVRSTLISPGATRSEMVERMLGRASGVPSASPAASPIGMLSVDAVARAIAYAIEQPPDVDVGEILLQTPGGRQ